jgi:hypothetical protein
VVELKVFEDLKRSGGWCDSPLERGVLADMIFFEH